MEETTLQKKQLNLKIKLKQEGDGHETSSQDRVDVSCAEGVQNELGNPSAKNSEHQLVVYNPAINGADSIENAPEPIDYRPPALPTQNPFPNQARKVMPSIDIFTVQCNDCLKWRLIPTKEKYEEIREHFTERPFVCETAQEWRSDVSCDDPPDITQDGSMIWAMDKPDISQPPSGWQRRLTIRGEGGTKFADVCYIAPSGKRLRSMQEIKRHLEQHPEYVGEGVSLSKFSFQIPRPLQENYVRKRRPQNDATSPGNPNNSEAGSSNPERPSKRRRRSPPEQGSNASGQEPQQF